jgi:hypothetical protein
MCYYENKLFVILTTHVLADINSIQKLKKKSLAYLIVQHIDIK